MMAIKTKLRVCEICGTKKKVAEFSIGRICNKCEEPSTSTLREELTDEAASQISESKTSEMDEMSQVESSKISEMYHDLHVKVDLLNHRLGRMETLMLGLMELVGKINYDMEISKIKSEE